MEIRRRLIMVVCFLLCSFFALGQEVVPTKLKDPGAKNTEAEISKQDLKITAFSATDQANIQSLKKAFEERNKALVSISSDLANQKKEIEKLIDQFAKITIAQGSSYSSLSPAAQIKYQVQKALIMRKFNQIKEDIKPYFEKDNYMTEGERILFILKAIHRAVELVDIH